MRAESEMRISTTPQRDVEIVRGEGCLLFGVDGRTYLDFGVSHGACNLGHTHPAVVRALQDQARRLLFVGSGVRNDAGEASSPPSPRSSPLPCPARS